MATEKEKKTTEETEQIETTVDPYTGELKPVPEDADQFIEVVPEETDDREGKNYILKEETSMDAYVADADDDTAAQQAAHYTDDKEIQADFLERQRLAAGGREELLEELDEHNFLSPDLSGGDIDASWQTGTAAGEETVGGSAPTPDQDIVDDLGAAAGLNYDDDEPLNSDAKILDRDRNRWELNPASADDDKEDEDDEDLEEEEDFEDLADLLDDERLDEDVDEEEDEDSESDDLDEEDEDDDEEDLDEYIDGELEDEDKDDA